MKGEKKNKMGEIEGAYTKLVLSRIQMSKFIHNEDAIAYSIVIFFSAIIISALLFYAFQEPIDILTTVLNEMIVAGDVTTETTENITILLKLFLFGIPFFVIISAMEYAIVKALEAKKDEGYL